MLFRSSMDAVSAIAVACDELPDLVILDLGLPVGDDGFLVLEQMKQLPELATTPVIVLSARDPSQNKQRALDDGAIAYFQKPADHREFLDAIRQALGGTVALHSYVDN